MQIYVNTIMLDNGTAVTGYYDWIDVDNLEELNEKLEDSDTMIAVAKAIGFQRVLDTDESDWEYIEGDEEDLGKFIIERDYSLDYDLEDYFDFEKFGEDYLYYNEESVVETGDGFLIEC